MVQCYFFGSGLYALLSIARLYQIVFANKFCPFQVGMGRIRAPFIHVIVKIASSVSAKKKKKRHICRAKAFGQREWLFFLLFSVHTEAEESKAWIPRTTRARPRPGQDRMFDNSQAESSREEKEEDIFVGIPQSPAALMA